jgi:hypothetical protein
MYKIERKEEGFALTFGGMMNKEEMEKWFQESAQALTRCSGAFGVVIDMRTLKPLPRDAQATMVQGQGLYKKAGMQRSAVILDNAVTAMQFKRLAKESGIYAFERYLDASGDASWEKHAMDWVKSGIDPDK